MMLRLVLAGVLGGLIGAEREYRGKVAAASREKAKMEKTFARLTLQRNFGIISECCLERWQSLVECT